MNDDLKIELEAILAPFDQTHLLQFWNELTAAERLLLAAQIREIDFELVRSLHSSNQCGIDWGDLAARAEAPPAITLSDCADRSSYQAAIEIGSEALSAGNVAMILVAGGQGSRLGFEHPKGLFPIGPISNRTLYQMHIDHILARAEQFRTTIPLYVMSSPPTHDETTRFLADHQNFGLAMQDLKIFCQGTMPAIDRQGQLLLEHKHQIFVSPDGHGGMLAALANSGCLADLQRRGVQHVFYGQVDNPLIQICHPALIGFHIQQQSEMTSQVVRKTDPLQKVGNVVCVDGHVRIIEYSDLPEQQARLRTADGSLKLWAGSIAVHVFDTDFLVRSHQRSETLPFHRANKCVPCLDRNGNPVRPSQPNAIKFEKFIFDLLPAAKNSIVSEVDPADGFCAVKNSAPAQAETPQHVRQAIIDLHTRWLNQAGVTVAPNIPVEINPRFAVDAEQLATRMIGATTIEQPTYFDIDQFAPLLVSKSISQ